MSTKTRNTQQKECFNLCVGALAGVLSDRLAYLRTLEATVRRIKIIDDENNNEWARAAAELDGALKSIIALCNNLQDDKRWVESLAAGAADARTRMV